MAGVGGGWELGRELHGPLDMHADSSRRRLITLLLSCTVPGLAAAGCGQVHGIPVDKTATDIAQAVCPKAWNCCTSDQLTNNSMAGTSEQDCEVESKQGFSDQLSGVQQSVDQKRSVYEQTKVDACLETIRSSTCAMLDVTNHLLGVPGCESFVTPLVSAGGACSNDYECIGGWCKPPTAPATGDGVCTATSAAGQSCAGNNCGSGLTCDPKTSDPTDDVCVAPGDTGAACADAFECQSFSCGTSGGSGMTCAAATSSMCFYSSGCSAAGGGRPGLCSVLLFFAAAAVTLRRARRRRTIRS
jgi:hypothetical protein